MLYKSLYVITIAIIGGDACCLDNKYLYYQEMSPNVCLYLALGG